MATTVRRSDVIDLHTSTITVWELVERRAAASPDDVMLVDGARRELTFEGFRHAAEITAAGLLERGVTAGGHVSWQLPTSLEAAVLMAALARLGAVQNPILPVLRRREVGDLLRRTAAEAFVVPDVVRGFDHAALADELEQALGVPSIRCGSAPAAQHGLTLPAGDPVTLGPPPDDLVVPRWRYSTSGTTAAPKIVLHTDASVIAAANALVHVGRLDPDDVVCGPIPITHIGGMVFLAAALRTGCRLILLDGFDPVETPRLAAELHTTVLAIVPAMFPAFFAAQRAQGSAPLLPRLRVAMSGGAPVPQDLHVEVRRHLGGGGVAAPWGLTEAPQVTFPELDASDAQLGGTVGRPAPGAEVRVTDPAGRELGPGSVGELGVRGPQCLAGYLDSEPDAAAVDADGYLRTGDLGWIGDDGYVRVTGRLKDVIIRNGENISAQEVEQVLLTHPAIADAAAIGLADERTGERCCAVVVLIAGATLDLATVRRHFEDASVARHKVPEQVEIVDEIPRNDMGKAQKHVLRERLTREHQEV